MTITTAGVMRGYRVLLGILIAVLLGGASYSFVYLPAAMGERVAHLVLIVGATNYAISLMWVHLYGPGTKRELHGEVNGLVMALVLVVLFGIGRRTADLETGMGVTIMAALALLFIAAIILYALYARPDRRPDRQRTDRC